MTARPVHRADDPPCGIGQQDCLVLSFLDAELQKTHTTIDVLMGRLPAEKSGWNTGRHHRL
ncbi:hypothetical protein MJ579_11400 [Klebsiella pneumoniae]|nr:hypothetical protein MJ579_11400 [Klebsiella pneumoniae]